MAAPIDGIHKIQHVVIIMQENRSFDSYFGTYPGANGIPAGVCVPIHSITAAWRRFTIRTTRTTVALRQVAFTKDLAEGKMDGFVDQAKNG